MTIQRPSVASVLIQMSWNDNELATGTGFVVLASGTPYLITNRHNLSGRRSDNDSLLSSRGVTPDAVTIVHNGAQLGTWIAVKEPLVSTSEEPLWLEHPVHGKAVDVVALRLTNRAGVTTYEYDPWDESQDVAVVASQDVSIVGFPFGITGGGSFGVWTRGAIATEPEVDFGGLPCFLIDSRTRPGQSGSPVLFHSAAGLVPMRDGGSAMYSGPVTKLLGVYSGRINEQSDLGFVWKTQVIREILSAATPGTA
ncbi:trypsin-like peptidase domain-containing protein [Pedococcus sp. P5_B7]